MKLVLVSLIALSGCLQVGETVSQRKSLEDEVDKHSKKATPRYLRFDLLEEKSGDKLSLNIRVAAKSLETCVIEEAVVCVVGSQKTLKLKGRGESSIVDMTEAIKLLDHGRRKSYKYIVSKMTSSPDQKGRQDRLEIACTDLGILSRDYKVNFTKEGSKIFSFHDSERAANLGKQQYDELVKIKNRGRQLDSDRDEKCFPAP